MRILQKYRAIVQSGRKLGRKLGFPTANMYLTENLDMPFGIYVVEIIYNQEHHFGVANYGVKPTIGDNKKTIEVHIFDFDKEIYGEYLELWFIYKIRDEQHFSSIDELKFQIGKDVEFSRDYIAREMRNN